VVSILPFIKQNKDAAGPRLTEFETHNCADLRGLARVPHFAKATWSNSDHSGIVFCTVFSGGLVG
jgi:hypothetical protein